MRRAEAPSEIDYVEAIGDAIDVAALLSLMAASIMLCLIALVATFFTDLVHPGLLQDVVAACRRART
jgi:hypothetical protein